MNKSVPLTNCSRTLGESCSNCTILIKFGKEDRFRWVYLHAQNSHFLLNLNHGKVFIYKLL